MKEIIYLLGWLLMGVLATGVCLAGMWICLAMPDILEWISGYIGELCTWGLFLSTLFGLIALFVYKCGN